MLLTTVLAALFTTALSAPLPAGPSPTPEEIKQAATTRNELLNGPCRNVTVLFARGTTESGNIGSLVGPALESALDARLGATNVAFQGVDYVADVAGYYAKGSDSGASTLASLVSTASSKCPNTQIVMSGYSQGAQVVYKAAAQLPPALAAQIKAAVLFGNPNNGLPVPNINNANTWTFCHALDKICQGQPKVEASHLDYAVDTPAAAAYIASRVKLNMS
ncbi:hypothetical protein LTR70_002724 [Exophiala xenobiotica]|uniref:Cutinase n=1 Tax=Lithohypha guttulata TaxID=1690604 RepID=A0ABR0KJL5_9EURO|nr:hypothetical protein LTR24_001830 [Lithohypha guttulata]KAK5324650.1 hypothetical protein LTR70_002724 [Exophiala xenobiotica]